jgi:hypothetical protein
VTRPDRTYTRGEGLTCPVDGKTVPHSKTKPRATCSDNCKTILFRLKRRQVEPCTHPQHGTGTYRVSPGVANAAVWFTSAAKGGPFLVLGADLRFLKNRQDRPYRRTSVSKAFARDHHAAEGHDPSWPSRGSGVDPAKDDALANTGVFDGCIRWYGKRTSRGRHRRRKDFSQAIGAYEASVMQRVGFYEAGRKAAKGK